MREEGARGTCPFVSENSIWELRGSDLRPRSNSACTTLPLVSRVEGGKERGRRYGGGWPCPRDDAVSQGMRGTFVQYIPSTLGHWSETFISTTYLHRGGEGELEKKQMAPLKEKSAQAGR